MPKKRFTINVYAKICVHCATDIAGRATDCNGGSMVEFKWEGFSVKLESEMNNFKVSVDTLLAAQSWGPCRPVTAPLGKERVPATGIAS